MKSLAAALAVLLLAVQPVAAQQISVPTSTSLPLSGSCGTVTVDTPCLNLTQTWNNAAVTFTGGIKLNVTDTASNAASLLMDLQLAGASRFKVDKNGTGTFANGLQVTGNASFSSAILPASGSYIGWNDDTRLYRDAANTLAQRNGASGQIFRVYNTFTDASNGEWGTFSWSANALNLLTAQNGTGASRALRVGTAGSSDLYLHTNNVDRWYLQSSTGHLLAITDNTYDIGASGATRPRTIYAGTSVLAPLISSAGHSVAAATSAFQFDGRTQLYAPADGSFQIANSSATATANFTVPTSNTIQHGLADAAVAVAQTNSVQSVVAGTLDTAGAARTFKGSAGTGTGAGGSIIFQTAPAAASTASTQNAFVTALTIDHKAHIAAGGTAPAVTSCGTTPSIVGSDTAGEVTTGTATPTACTITFNKTYTAQPYCTVENRSANTNLTSYAVTTSAITLTTAAASSQKIVYICIGA